MKPHPFEHHWGGVDPGHPMKPHLYEHYSRETDGQQASEQPVTGPGMAGRLITEGVTASGRVTGPGAAG